MLKHFIQERKNALDTLQAEEILIQSIADKLISTLQSGNRIYTCGNGGSAAEAQHFSTELIGQYNLRRRSLPAYNLNGDGTAMTCIINDFGADSVFSRQLEGLATKGDCLAVFSTSGNSPNIVHALRAASDLGMHSIAFLGKGGGAASGLATTELVVSSDSTAVVQEIHLLLIHLICEKIDQAFTHPE